MATLLKSSWISIAELCDRYSDEELESIFDFMNQVTNIVQVETGNLKETD